MKPSRSKTGLIQNSHCQELEAEDIPENRETLKELSRRRRRNKQIC